MTPTLMSCKFADIELDGSCCNALLEAKHRALAILHDCPQVLPTATQLFNQLTVLPEASDLIYRQASPEEWLACAIKALIEANLATSERSGHLERYAAKALEHAGRILKHQQGLQDGYQQHVAQAAIELATNRQKAEKAKAAKGKKTRQAVTDVHARLVQENGLFSGIDKAVAEEVGVKPSTVSKILNKKKVNFL